MSDEGYFYVLWWIMGVGGVISIFFGLKIIWRVVNEDIDAIWPLTGPLGFLLALLLVALGMFLVHESISKYGNYRYYQGRKDTVGLTRPIFYLPFCPEVKRSANKMISRLLAGKL